MPTVRTYPPDAHSQVLPNFNSELAGSQASGTITVPDDVEDGDRALLVADNINNSELVGPAGWTADTQVPFGTAGAKLFRKTLTTADRGVVLSYSMTVGSRTTAVLVIVSGAQAQSGEALADGNVPDNGDNSNNRLTAPTVTSANDSELVVLIGAVRHSNAAGFQSTVETYPGGFTEIFDMATTNGSGNRAGTFVATLQRGASTAGTATTGGDIVTASAGAIGAVWAFSFPAVAAPPPGGGGTPPPVGWTEVRLYRKDTAPVGDYFGWDPAGSAVPPRKAPGELMFYNNTGLFRQADRDALTVVTPATTYSSPQTVVGLDFEEKVTLAPGCGVVDFKLCRFRKGIDTGGLGPNDKARLMYSDAIRGLGVASTSTSNFSTGAAIEAYRCNISGYVDAFAIKTANDNTGHTTIVQDNFLHDPRVVDDPGQPGRSHSDLYQTLFATNLKWIGNTCFVSGVLNDGTNVETWTRDSGPHWVRGTGGNDTPRGATFPGARTGGDAAGRTNAGLMFKDGAGATAEVRENFFVGYAYTFINATTGNFIYVTDNIGAPEHVEDGRSQNALGNQANLSDYARNTHWQTGAAI